jgi:transposase
MRQTGSKEIQMTRKDVLAAACSISAGLDVDRHGSAVILLDPRSGEIVYEGRLAHDRRTWQRFLNRLPGCRITAFYEAGPMGYTLCRRLHSLGVDCRVVAPSQVPKASNLQQTKTDRRDAFTLAQLYFHPPRSFVRVPDEQEEARRQLVRLREQLLEDKQRVMRRIKSLLLNYGFDPPADSGKSWSKAWRQWLRDLDPGFEELRFTLDVMLDELDSIEQQLERINERLRQLAKHPDYREAANRLMKIPGVGPLLTMTFLLELFRPEEFASAEALAAHCGLTPCEYSSGGKQRRGHITRWGPPALRRLLVEATWIWVSKDSQAQHRFQTIRAGKSPKVAVVGMARRLAVALWAMTVKKQEFAYHWKQ